ncbi:hypothetical protein LXL04_013927 [Taraxacum kok-saghyz]
MKGKSSTSGTCFPLNTGAKILAIGLRTWQSSGGLCADKTPIGSENGERRIYLNQAGSLSNSNDDGRMSQTQAQIWISLRFSSPPINFTNRFQNGFAIGAAVAKPDAIVVDIDGDGSFMMNVQELATIRVENLPVKILLLNNQHLGMVVQWEDRFIKQIEHTRI